jgi:hypothetical protein
MQPKDNDTANTQTWVSGSELADELSVSPARLGNWRTRYDNFPKTKKSASGVTLYHREKVKAWKKTQFDMESIYERRLDVPLQLLEIARGSADPESIIALTFALLCLRKMKMEPSQLSDQYLKQKKNIQPVDEVVHAMIKGRQSKLDEKVIDLLWNLVSGSDELDVTLILSQLDSTISKLRGRTGYLNTPDPLNDLISRLVTNRNTEIFDPASGEGRTLFQVATEKGGSVIGQDTNPQIIQIAIMRAYLLGIKSEFRNIDSLANPFTGTLFKVVVADPPMGMKLTSDVPSFVGPFGPIRFHAEWAWIQTAVMNLADDGEGYINVVAGALFNHAAINVRREMIRRGCIEAVIALPPLSSAARVPTALICLRAPGTKVGRNVLLIDASDVLTRDDKEFREKIPQIVQSVQKFRKNANLFESDEYSTVVSTLDLLEGDCSLVPSRHIAKARKASGRTVGEFLPLLTDVADAFQKIPNFNLDSIRSGRFEILHTSFRELRMRDVATLISGIRTEFEINRIDPKFEKFPEDVQRLITIQQLRKPGRLLATEYFASQKILSRAITQPGDIVIARVGESLAKVDSEGGNLVISPLSIIRLNSDFDPVIVAAALNGNFVRKKTLGASGIGRIDLDSVEIPQMSLADAQILRSAFERMEELEGSVEALKESLIAWRGQAGDLLATSDEVKI